MEKEPSWIFFDIDGTLLYARRAGRRAFCAAFEDALGWTQDVEHINFSGATDLDVFRRICADRGERSSAEMEARFFERLGVRLEAFLAETPPALFPHVERVIPALSRRCKLGVVTGNVDVTARAKLKHAGLLDYFDARGFGCGGDHPDRIEIARLALLRAGNPARAILVGDTPRDVEAANRNGMVSVAVRTGGCDGAALEAAGADYVFEDLTDLERLLSIPSTL